MPIGRSAIGFVGLVLLSAYPAQALTFSQGYVPRYTLVNCELIDRDGVGNFHFARRLPGRHVWCPFPAVILALKATHTRDVGLLQHLPIISGRFEASRPFPSTANWRDQEKNKVASTWYALRPRSHTARSSLATWWPRNYSTRQLYRVHCESSLHSQICAELATRT